MPISRNSWANASLWYVYDSFYEYFEERLRKQYTLKDSYSIGAAIKAILKKIDPAISHETTAEYSQFLYGKTNPLGLAKFYVYITQKTNILKGNYDQPAQKAETSLEELMKMLRDCFRCYWYIEDNKFKIEHIHFFMNGGSYSGQSSYQLDFTKLTDQFNKKLSSYFQSEVEFEKSDLNQRYEFAWMDDVTDLFGGVTIDVKSNYIQKDKTEEINISQFSSDVDYMLFNPSNFSDDGFALLCPIPKIAYPTLDLVGYYNLIGALNPTSNAKNTGFIPIAGYTKLEYQVDISKAGIAVSFWNKDREYIPSLSIPGAGLTSGTIDLTQSKYDDAEYIVISYYDATGSYSKYKGILSNENSLESRVAKLEESKEFTSVLLPSKDDKLSILIFGDSITDCASITIDSITNTTTAYSLRHPANSYTDSKGQLIRFDMWPYLITQYLNCFDLRNYAKSGASYKYSERETEDLKRRNLSYQIEVAINDINNPNGVFPTEGQFSPDIIIFALGTNDGFPNDTFDSAMTKTIMDEAGTSFDIEATLSNLDLSKFCEAARYAFLTIKKQFPYALCMCVLPIQRASSDIQQVGVNSELKKMAERYSIKVIDGASEMGIVRDLETSGGLGTSLKDGLHPNEKGQNLYARLVINAIKNNWLKLSLMNEM